MADIKWKRSLTAIAIAGLMAVGSGQLAYAQAEAEPEGEPGIEGQPEIDVSEQKLESFVTAVLAVDEVLQVWQPRLAEAETAEEAAAIQEEAAEEATQAVESTGLSIEEYEQINQAVQMDPQLQAQVVEMIEAEQNGLEQ